MAAREPVALRRVVWSLWAFVGILAVAALVVYLAARGGGSKPEAIPVSDTPAATWAAGKKTAPAFALRDEHGAPLSLASLRGRPVVITFIDPLCRDYCPTEAKRLSDAVRALPAAERPAIVAVSVNVFGNAPRILREDRQKWHLSPEWRWGLGRPAQLAQVWRAYGIQVMSRTKKIAGVTVHQVGHTEAAYVVDAHGRQRALFLWPYSTDGLLQALRALS
jgi:cytochrome oxidase Cu insertion factor (SCO1/SenC/PrrC family)